MRNSKYLRNMLFTLLVGFISIVYVVINAFFPDIMLAKLSIPLIVLLLSIPEIVCYYLGKDRRDLEAFLIGALLDGITIAVIPFLANQMVSSMILPVIAIGALLSAFVDAVYLSMARRMRTGRKAAAAPVVNGLMLFLAFQCLQGIL